MLARRIFVPIVCTVLFSTSYLVAQDDELAEAELPQTSWLQTKQEGSVSILGIIYVDQERQLTFDSAVRTLPVRIVPVIDERAEGIALIENGDESQTVYPVIMTGDYTLEDAQIDNQRFAYQPAEFFATKIQILQPEEIATLTEAIFPDVTRREDYRRRIAPLSLDDCDLYIDDLKLSKSIAANRGHSRATFHVYLTLRNLSGMPEGFDLEMPAFQLTDANGDVNAAEVSERPRQDNDRRRYYLRLNGMPRGELNLDLRLRERDGSIKTFPLTIPQQKRPAFKVRPIPAPMPVPRNEIPKPGK